MNERNWIKEFIARHKAESASIPQFMLDAYAPTQEEKKDKA